MKITEVESFRVQVPLTEQQQGTAGYYNSTGITRVRTDGGIVGYGFTECDAEEVSGILVGGDPFAVERHRLIACAAEAIVAVSDSPAFDKPLLEIAVEDTLGFRPHFGWTGHVELTASEPAPV